MITFRHMTTAIRNVPRSWIRMAVAGASGAIIGAGLMGSLLISRTPADLDSFGGGYSYVSHRGAVLRDAGIDPVAACEMYADEYFAYIDGFKSRDDFKTGCRAAAARKK